MYHRVLFGSYEKQSKLLSAMWAIFPVLIFTPYKAIGKSVYNVDLFVAICCEREGYVAYFVRCSPLHHWLLVWSRHVSLLICKLALLRLKYSLPKGHYVTCLGVSWVSLPVRHTSGSCYPLVLPRKCCSTEPETQEVEKDRFWILRHPRNRSSLSLVLTWLHHTLLR